MLCRLQTARKRLAVPFRAADTPSPRSEFAQPDVALLLTHLSYYSDGLSLTEFKAALDQLLLMGPSAQEDHYNQWLQLSATRIAAGEALYHNCSCCHMFVTLQVISPGSLSSHPFSKVHCCMPAVGLLWLNVSAIVNLSGDTVCLQLCNGLSDLHLQITSPSLTMCARWTPATVSSCS